MSSLLAGLAFASKDEKRKSHKKSKKKSKKSKKKSSEKETDEVEEKPKASTVQREDWMTMTIATSRNEPVDPILTLEEEKERKIQEEIDQGKREPVTRMPYGLYKPKGADDKPESTPQFGDGGASWRAKMLKRAQERAEEQGTTMEEELHERFLTQKKRQPESTEAPVAKRHATSSRRPVVDMNKLASQALRAKMMGNDALFKKLTKELEDAEADGNVEEKEEVVMINPFDEHGRVIPSLHQSAEEPRVERADLKLGSRRGKLKGSVDEDISLEELVRRERMTGPSDIDSIHAKNIIRLGGRYKGTELGGKSASGMDEEDQVDVKMFESSSSRMTGRMQKERDVKRAISESNKWNRITQQCAQCFKSPQFKKHLLIALGDHAYLSLPSKPTLGNGHCILSPVEHTEASNSCDEQIWAELVKFKQALYRMFRSEKQGVIFLEKTAEPHRKRHTYIECIAVPLEVEADAALYFKQALMEVDEEWSTHKKIIDTHQKGIRRSVPSGFSYFHVEWASGGYAHVIDDQKQFPNDFGVDVVAGMMGVDPPKYGRQRPSFEQERCAVQDFIKRWQPFDWTTELDG